MICGTVPFLVGWLEWEGYIDPALVGYFEW